MYNLREAFRETEAYSTFNREERNCVAILYHALLLNGNLPRFLSGTATRQTRRPNQPKFPWSFPFFGTCDVDRQHLSDRMG